MTPLDQREIIRDLIGLIDSRLRAIVTEPELAGPGRRLIATHVNAGQSRTGGDLRADSRESHARRLNHLYGVYRIEAKAVVPYARFVDHARPKGMVPGQVHVLDPFGLLLGEARKAGAIKGLIIHGRDLLDEPVA